MQRSQRTRAQWRRSFVESCRSMAVITSLHDHPDVRDHQNMVHLFLPGPFMFASIYSYVKMTVLVTP